MHGFVSHKQAARWHGSCRGTERNRQREERERARGERERTRKGIPYQQPRSQTKGMVKPRRRTIKGQQMLSCGS
jgi:hypothetical protein